VDGRAAIVGAIAVAAVGLLAYLVLGGVAGGLALFVAGLLIVAIGLLGWQDRREPASDERANRTVLSEAAPGRPDHAHEDPVGAEDDLLAHVRESHPEVSLDAVRRELRRLHERAHGRSDGS
jgi:predicted lipid-binding transport protein (Tim44 family)